MHCPNRGTHDKTCSFRHNSCLHQEQWPLHLLWSLCGKSHFIPEKCCFLLAHLLLFQVNWTGSCSDRRMVRQLGQEPFSLVHRAKTMILNLNEWIKCLSDFIGDQLKVINIPNDGLWVKKKKVGLKINKENEGIWGPNCPQKHKKHKRMKWARGCY